VEYFTIDELYKQPEPERRFLIDSLLPAGGITILVGKPKAGKSCLARQAIVACATGSPFLGFDAKQCAVLYIAIEEWGPEVSRHFRDLDLPADAPVHIHVGTLGPSRLVAVKEKLTAHPDIKLIVIDPVLLAVDVKDANEYLPMMRALAELREVTRKNEVAILGVHHAKKAMSADAGDNALGSIAIRASSDANWQIIVGANGQRTLQTEMRYGKFLPPTILIFDEDSRISRLGGAEADLGRRQAAINREKVEDTILDYVGKHPNGTREEALEHVPYKSVTKSDAFTDLVNRGMLCPSGLGVKGDPFRYTVNIPTEPDYIEA
jgi:hypothetical protein